MTYTKKFAEEYDKNYNRNTKIYSIFNDDIKFPLLDIACGTGNFLEYVEKKFEPESIHLYGFDLSPNMLRFAKKKTSANLSIQDMLKFKYKKKFKTITCFYDSINHIQDFKRVFQNAYNHLSEDGNFIFDYNTIDRLKTFAEPKLFELKGNYSAHMGSYDSKTKSGHLNISTFTREKGKRNKYIMNTIDIIEYSHTKTQINKWLREIGFKITILESGQYRIMLKCTKK